VMGSFNSAASDIVCSKNEVIKLPFMEIKIKKVNQ